MRIISGTARGAKLFTLDGNDITRPTLDRIKEPLFSMLMNYLQDANVLDLFSGSGALGLEAISRGAKKAFLCDNSWKAISVIKENVKKLRMEEQVSIITADYKKALEQLKNEKFDIIFLDPPYKTDYDIQAIEIIKNQNIIAKDGIIVLETDSDKKIQELENIDVNIFKIRKYGRVKLVFLN